MLTASEIKSAGIIIDGCDGSYRGASYDLRIKNMLTTDGKTQEVYDLPAQGIVEAMSIERVKLPSNVAGFALVKTGLCNEGILALNIGIIDPGWDGPLTSFLVNFGKHDRSLSKGEVFLRLTFHRLSKSVAPASRSITDEDAYVAERRRRVTAHFGSTFLNVSDVLEKFSKKTFDEYKLKVLGLVSAAAFLLALVTFFLNFANITTQRYLQTGDAGALLSSREQIERLISTLTEQNKALRDRVDLLERRLPANPNPQQGPSK